LSYGRLDAKMIDAKL